ncbi:hypothetical protein AX16_008513 [Volvariella volvacea WC 439]|nr:hypothetical protein AX16_008513 [Volvariella volvacea WC 439]
MAHKAIHASVMLLFHRWSQAVGSTVAKQTRVCVIGSLYWEARDICKTPDVDIFVQSNQEFTRFKIRDLIAKSDNRFTASAESRCGLTYHENPGDPVVTYDIVNEQVTLYEPQDMSLTDVVAEDVLPLPTDTEAIIMKLANHGEEEKAMVKLAFDSFYDKYVAFKQALPRDLPDAFFWMKEKWELYLKIDKIGTITYKNDAEKKMVLMAFNAFYPAFKKAQEEQGEEVMSEEAFKAYLKLD